MKKPITKANIRSDINQQIADFLEKGGEVDEIQRGLSGRVNPTGPIATEGSGFIQPKTERTYLPDVVAAIEPRKSSNKIKATSKKRKPRKKIIYDDFGEPLRWEWAED